MKRFALLLLIPAILLLLLGRDALMPGRFTGAWYEAGTGEEYWFEEGIIRKDELFRGAYSFTRSSITLFALRAAVVVEAAMAIALADLKLRA